MTISQIIATHNPDWAAQSDAAIFAQILSDTAPNPQPCPQIPRTVYSMELLMLLSQPSMKAVAHYNNLHLVKAAINEQNHNAMIEWVYVLYFAECIDQSELNDCLAHVMGTVPDPSWQAEIPAIELEIGRALTLDDVMDARRAWLDTQTEEAI